MIIDTHSHLSSSRYENISEIIENFKSAGGGLLIDVGYDKKTSLFASDLSKKENICFFAAGYHPSEEAKNNDYEVIEALLQEKKCVALGEVGLDYHYDGFEKSRQRELFERQIVMADKAKLPVVVHSRDASKDMLDIISANKKYFNHGFLMHCYSESKEQAAKYLDLGGYFAFGGAITFKNAKKDEIIRYIPVDRIMAETDCPYMTPEPFRGKRNEPALVSLVYKKLADILNVEADELEATIENNVRRFFYKLDLA